jgi:uncharacterized protein YqhQ
MIAEVRTDIMKEKKEQEMSLAFGGQAVIEGVLMRSKNYSVVCVRKEDGSLVKITHKLDPKSKRYRVLRWPFVRGIYALFETMYIGMRALYHSANANLGEEEQIKPSEMVVTAIFALILGIVFFAVLPFFTTQWLNFKGLLFNIIEGILRLVIFLLYLVIISLVGSFRRVLQYHGAEHSAINMFESKEAGFTDRTKLRFHPRCGTSFILIILLISIFVFSIMPDLGWAINFSYRLLLMPVIAGLSYEILKFSDKHKDSKVMKAMVAPGLALQRLTTKEPTEDMIEVAMEAIKEVDKLERELSDG